MNDIAKTSIKEKLEKAMEIESMKPTETAHIFGIHPNYISMIRNPNTWMKCPASAWEKVLDWINSGQTLKQYSEKHGLVLPEKPKQIISKVVKIEPAKEVIKEKVDQQRLSKGQFMDMLIEEKELMKRKIDAIDLLLQHYIS